MPEAFFAIFSHTPADDACCSSSQRFHATRSANSRIGRSSRGIVASTLVGRPFPGAPLVSPLVRWGRYSRPPPMAKLPPLYDLVLLLSTTAPEEQRAKILSDVESKISAAEGSIERRD